MSTNLLSKFPKSLSGFQLVPNYLAKDLSDSGGVSESDEKDDIELKRFGQVVESPELRKLRAYLLASEVSASTRSKTGKGKDVSRSYTFSNPTPGLKYKPADNHPFPITQEYNVVSFLTSSTSIPAFAATSFIVNSLDQIASLAGVFDQYIIDQIEIWLEPEIGPFSATNVIQSTANGLVSVVDYDDANALTTFPSMLDYTNALQTNISECHYRKFRPHIAVAAYSGTFVSFANEASTWIDANSPSVQHYGLKVAVGVTNVTTIYGLRVRLSTRWRNVR